MTHEALAYAEQTLGVHSVYEEAQRLAEQLDQSLSALDKAQDERRELDEKIADFEMDLLMEERSKHPDHSEAAFARHLKEVHHKSEPLKLLRSQRNAKAGECSGHELDIKFIETQVRIATSRMVELGGYFQYLAAVKLGAIQAEQTNQPT